MEIYERLRYLRKEVLHMSQTAFGERLGVSRSEINNIERNVLARPDQKLSLLKLVAREFNVREEWLMTGEEPMTKQADIFSLDEFCKECGASELELAAVKAYFALSDDTRKEIMENFASIFQSEATSSKKEIPLTPEEIDAEVERYRALLKRERALKLALGYGTPPQTLASGDSSDSGNGGAGSSGNDTA